MKLSSGLLGQIVTVGVMAVVFILALKYVGQKWNIPVISTAAAKV
jgi:hypothetical protein